MKLAFKNRRMRHMTTWVALVAGLLASPYLGIAGEPIQQQPDPDQQEQPVQQEVQEFTKTVKKEFPISPTGLVDLTNKYGKVEVHTWERDRVKIDVTIVVDARSESAAQDVFDRIQIEFNNDNDFVKAETIIESSNSWWGGGWNNKSEFQINYEVYMPASCNLELNNQYGDSNVEAISGKADVNVKYGNFQLEGVGGDLHVYLGYGNGTVVKARDVSAEVSYSKINFNTVQDVDFTTKYSKIYLDQGASIKADSRYDHFSLGKIDRLNCESRYGNIEVGDAETVIANSRYTDYIVGQLRESADFSIEYGGLKVKDLKKGFSNVVLEGKYSDFKVYVEPGASFTLDGATNYAGIVYPTGMNVTYEKDKGTSHEVKGHVGTEGARSSIKANLNYGGLKVRYRE
jgi:hypothetical protein